MEHHSTKSLWANLQTVSHNVIKNYSRIFYIYSFLKIMALIDFCSSISSAEIMGQITLLLVYLWSSVKLLNFFLHKCCLFCPVYFELSKPSSAQPLFFTLDLHSHMHMQLDYSGNLWERRRVLRSEGVLKMWEVIFVKRETVVLKSVSAAEKSHDPWKRSKPGLF